MKPRPHNRTSPRGLVALAGITLVTLLVATSAFAEISPIKPSEGIVEPGEKAKAHFTVVDSVTSCFVGTAPSGFTVSFDGLPASCAPQNARVMMTVAASLEASPGDYSVTITETALGGSLIATHEWPFTVVTPPTTTTTIPTTTTTSLPAVTTTTPGGATTTSQPTVTTTSHPTATTTAPGGVTSTSTPLSSPTSTVGPGSSATTVGPSSPSSPFPETSPRTDASPAGATTPAPAGPEEGGDDTSSGDETEVLAAGISDDSSPPYNRYPRLPQIIDPEGMALSDPLRGQNSNPLAMFLADRGLAPGAIGEFIFGSLFAGANDLMIPMLIAASLGLVMVWRMRLEVDDDELALSRQSLG